MMRIEGDKINLYQWDLNQRLILTNVKPGVEVHYSDVYIKDDDCIVLLTYEENGVIYANIPNIMLQKKGIIGVYVYIYEDDEAYTKEYAEILVLPREKPVDYVYEEEEIKTYKSLEKRLERLETGGSGGPGSSLPVVSDEDNGKILQVKEGKWVAEELPTYDGDYDITPGFTEQKLFTKQKLMEADVTIQQIPVFEVSNEAGGTTVYIGKETEINYG